MKVIPFINTILSNRYRVFMLENFNPDKIKNLFEGWEIKNMVGWYKMSSFTDKSIIEFYGEGGLYCIKTPTNTYNLPYPNNLDDFICDCSRCSVSLTWKRDILHNFNRNEIMDINKIEEYNNNLLRKIGKS